MSEPIDTSRRAACVGGLALGASLLAGCGGGARSTALVAPLSTATLVTEANPLFRAVAVGVVDGGQETTLLSGSQVSNANLVEALETSLDLTLLLAPGGEQTAYVLDATLEDLDQPVLQLTLTVTATMLYRLRKPSGELLFQERITTPFTSKFSDSFIRSERFRLANEGAVKANITEFLNRLVAYSERNPVALL